MLFLAAASGTRAKSSVKKDACEPRSILNSSLAIERIHVALT